MMADMIRKVEFEIVVRSPIVGVYHASRLEAPLQNRQKRRTIASVHDLKKSPGRPRLTVDHTKDP